MYNKLKIAVSSSRIQSILNTINYFNITRHVRHIKYVKQRLLNWHNTNIKETRTMSTVICKIALWTLSLAVVFTSRNREWFYDGCKWIFSQFQIEHVVSHTDMLFYFSVEMTLILIILRVFKLHKAENYTVKNAVIIYMNFLAVEKFADTRKFFALFGIAYRSTYLAALFLYKFKKLHSLFDIVYSSSIIGIYVQLFFPMVLSSFE